jgi:hypothetical protein
VILVLMCYTVYLGLDNEYEILASEQFAERAQESDDVDVVSGVDPQDVSGGADVESSD